MQVATLLWLLPLVADCHWQILERSQNAKKEWKSSRILKLGAFALAQTQSKTLAVNSTLPTSPVSSTWICPQHAAARWPSRSMFWWFYKVLLGKSFGSDDADWHLPPNSSDVGNNEAGINGDQRGSTEHAILHAVWNQQKGFSRAQQETTAGHSVGSLWNHV
eukprot:Skav216563  [mRNA]  locus=scaffold1231:16626:19315:+ [translate_table: standard]